jgi:hypothetical protein
MSFTSLVKNVFSPQLPSQREKEEAVDTVDTVGGTL